MDTNTEKIDKIQINPTEQDVSDSEIAREAQIYLEYIANAEQTIESIALDLAGDNTTNTEGTNVSIEAPTSGEDSHNTERETNTVDNANLDTEPIEPINLTIVDITHKTSNKAKDRARERLTESKEDREGNIIKRTFMRIFKYGYLEGYFYSKYKKDALSEFLEKRTNNRTLNRFEMGAIHEKSNEVIKKIDSESESSEKIKELLIKLAQGDLTPEEYEAKKQSAISALYKEQGLSQIGTFGFEKFEDSISQYIDSIQALIEHGKSIEEIKSAISIEIGVSKDLIKTEASMKDLDKRLESMRSRRPRIARGILNSETSIALGTALLLQISRSVLESKVAAYASFGGAILVSSIWAGARENQRMKRDRQLHGRDLAMGKDSFGSAEKRRSQMEKAIYEYLDVKETTNDLDTLVEKIAKNKELFDKGSAEFNAEEAKQNFFSAIAKIGQFNARVGLSEERSIDLLMYSSPDKIEEEYAMLLLTSQYIQKEIFESPFYKEYIQRLFGWELGYLGLDTQKPDDIKRFFEMLLETAGRTSLTQIESDREAKDAEFQKVKNVQVLKFVSKNLLSGLIVGGALSGIYYEFIEKAKIARPEFRGKVSDSAKSFIERAKQSTAKIGNTTIYMPKGVSIKNIGGSNYLQYGNKNIEIGNKINPSLISKLRKSGVILQTNTVKTVTSRVQTTRTNLSNYFQTQKGEIGRVKVERQMWWDNNNPPGVDTKNELRLDWGSNTGYTGNNSVIFNVSRMTNSGSFEGASALPAHNLVTEGKTVLWISPSKQTQFQPFQFKISSDGNVIIPKNSPAYKLFTQGQGGHAVFHGAYVEVVQVKGVSGSGKVIGDPIATYVGENNAGKMTTTITKVKSIIDLNKVARIVLKNTNSKIKAVSKKPFNPIFVPFPPRVPLEMVEDENQQEDPENTNTSPIEANPQNTENLDTSSVNAVPQETEHSSEATEGDQKDFDDALRNLLIGSNLNAEAQEKLFRILKLLSHSRNLNNGSITGLTIDISNIEDITERYNSLFKSLYEKTDMGYEDFKLKLETDAEFRTEVFQIFNMILRIFNSRNT